MAGLDPRAGWVLHPRRGDLRPRAARLLPLPAHRPCALGPRSAWRSGQLPCATAPSRTSPAGLGVAPQAGGARLPSPPLALVLGGRPWAHPGCDPGRRPPG
eukprot:1316762-Alexandrium_andersonii.AAC.1